MRIAIFGSSGFIGRHLAQAARAAGHEVHCLDNNPAENDAVFCDLGKAEALSLPFAVDAVFYLAQSPHYRNFPEHAENLFSVNSLGPAIAAKAAAKAGCRFFCFASSGNVYKPSFAPLAESSPAVPASAYAASKLMGEMSSSCFKDLMRVLNCRIFGAYGPGQKAMLPYALLSRILNGGEITLEPGPAGPDGGLKVSFIYIADLATRLLALARLALSGQPLPKTLNLGGPKPISVSEFAEALGKASGKAPCFTHGTKPRPFDLWADITLLESLCPMPFTPLEAGAAEMAKEALASAPKDSSQ